MLFLKVAPPQHPTPTFALCVPREYTFGIFSFSTPFLKYPPPPITMHYGNAKSI